MFSFSVTHKDIGTKARAGRVSTARGDFDTPVFMPVGTQATVKGILPRDVEETGSKIILCNAYHLALRPGAETVAKFGGLHKFMNWNRPILTDSGGYQVFSLPKLNKITDEGVAFQSHIDGSPIFLSPEKVVEIQRQLGSDIIMPLDQPIANPSTKEDAREAMERTILWARRSREVKLDGQTLFGIVQGGTSVEMRAECAKRLAEMDFPGYSAGGLSLGETKDEMRASIDAMSSNLPQDKPLYAMGIGMPKDIVMSVSLGVDMFDCVLPTRVGRNGWAFVQGGLVRIKNAKHREEDIPLEDGCPCYACKHYSRGYIKHLFNTDEMLGPTLMSLHNITYYQRLMERIRAAIREDNLGKILAESASWEK